MKTKTKRNIFDKNFAPYGTYFGERGNPQNWADSFKQRFSNTEIKEILGEDNPWFILGLTVGATIEAIKAAYRKLVFETHPDHHPEKDGSEFRKVRAAYEKLVFN